MFGATHKPTGLRVALKRLKHVGTTFESDDRMRREIAVQSSLNHPNIMPIWAHDPDFSWFAMPLATGSLEKLRPSLDDGQLARAILDASVGLAFAHRQGNVHRDVTPSNILLVGDSWVVADWGLVRRPHGETTMRWTGDGVGLGTRGFAAPETEEDGHGAGPAADIYSLGRVMAWATTGKRPKPNVPLVPDGSWRHLVQVCTYPEVERRPSTMEQIAKLLDDALKPLPKKVDMASELLSRLRSGDGLAPNAIIDHALAAKDDNELYFDCVPQLAGASLESLVVARTDDLAIVVGQLAALLNHSSLWGSRNFDGWNVPLSWFRQVGSYAIAHGKAGLLEEAANALFACDPRLNRFPSRQQSTAWISACTDAAADVVARALRRAPTAIAWYSARGWVPSRVVDPRIRALFE